MAHSHTHSDFDLSPEEAVRRINADRKRRSWIAAGLFALGAATLGILTYLASSDVPSPSAPGNAPQVSEQQR
jgi:hypothetical protein